jgi:endonuclease/exonuclease/phosphatase family metal-dependent hydrolase
MTFPRRCLAAAVALASLAAPAAAQAQSSTRDVTVMSRNLYLGADIITAATASDREDLRNRASALYDVVNQTNFPARAKALVAEVRANRPDLIGLQEVAHWRRTPDGVTNDAKDATVTHQDFLAIFLRELRARGLRYRAAVVQQEADFEVPTSRNFDVRLTMRDVILVRNDRNARVSVRRTLRGNYRTNLTVNIPIGAVVSLRGWTGVDARLRGRSFRFVNTHLEAYGGEIRNSQARELLRGPLAGRRRQTILVGDLNSAPDDTGDEALAYRSVRSAGFVNAFRRAPATSGQDEKLDNATSKLRRYIDHIMYRPSLRVVRTRVVGNRPSDRVSGLWPSDHAGTVARLRLRR